MLNPLFTDSKIGGSSTCRNSRRYSRIAAKRQRRMPVKIVSIGTDGVALSIAREARTR
jgi:hypothetical protein